MVTDCPVKIPPRLVFSVKYDGFFIALLEAPDLSTDQPYALHAISDNNRNGWSGEVLFRFDTKIEAKEAVTVYLGRYFLHTARHAHTQQDVLNRLSHC